MKMSFTAAMNKFFGKKEGQSMGQFADELKTLDSNDRAYFKAEFAKQGVEIEESVKA